MTASALVGCAGFLLAVLWLDLIFDTQLGFRRGNGRPDETALASIAGYYRRATARPMSALIAVVMGILLSALGIEALRGERPGWMLALSAVLGGVPILGALLRTVPNAVRLGRQCDPLAEQMRLARTILRDHVVFAVCMLVLFALWLTRGQSAA